MGTTGLIRVDRRAAVNLIDRSEAAAISADRETSYTIAGHAGDGRCEVKLRATVDERSVSLFEGVQHI
jgi:hypothetical protein